SLNGSDVPDVALTIREFPRLGDDAPAPFVLVWGSDGASEESVATRASDDPFSEENSVSEVVTVAVLTEASAGILGNIPPFSGTEVGADRFDGDVNVGTLAKRPPRGTVKTPTIEIVNGPVVPL